MFFWEKKKLGSLSIVFFFFFFLNSTRQARLFSSILFKITKIFRMITKMNSSAYMHTRYSYLCVWTYEEESSNETISLGQYIDRRFKVLFIDYHAWTILLCISSSSSFLSTLLTKRNLCYEDMSTCFSQEIHFYDSSVPFLPFFIILLLTRLLLRISDVRSFDFLERYFSLK